MMSLKSAISGLVSWVSLLLVVSRVYECKASWQDNVQPRLRIHSLPTDRVVRFRSEQQQDHFRLLDHDGDHFLIGAKNAVYNVSAVTLTVRRRLDWRPSESDVSMCRLKGKSEEACHNYIRVIAKKAEDRVLVCGTNAYKPKCRDYALLPSGPPPPPSGASPDQAHRSDREFRLTEEKPGEGLCPYDPNHNSTFTFAAPLGYRTDGDLYVGTVGQFSGADPLIYRKPLRTEQFDLKHLNAPQFVSSMHLGGFVYFFFRESAVEYINCGKVVYSRVARVCTNDQGGPHKFKERFTSFLKARLNCSIPGEVPFYFNELQSTSPIVEGSYRGERARLIYSILTTGPNSISGSAVCAFRLEDIDTAFHGAFKGQEDKNSNWLPVINSKVPEPRPGQCVNSSKSLPDATLNFIANHPLMDQAVPAYLGRPVVVHTGFTYRYTYITVDGQVEATSGKPYDVLFIGTDHGHVLKVINIASLAEGSDSQQPASPVIVEDVHVFGKASGEPFASTAHSGPIAITHLVVQRSPYEQKLIVVSNSEIQGIPLFHCHRAQTCGDCVRLQDPYCAWNLDERKCTHNWRRNRHASVQSVERGWDERCGTNTEDLGTGELNEVSRNRLLLGDSASLHLRLRDAPDAAAKDGPKGAAATLLNHFNHSLAVHPCLPCVAPNSSRDGKLSAVSHAPAARPYPNSVAIVGDSRGSPPSDVGGGERPYPDVTNVVRTSGPLFPPSSEYSAETLAIAVTTSIVTALVVGFISGYIFARRCKNDIDMDSVPEEYTRYVDVNRMGGLMGPDLGMGGGYGGAHYEPTYALPPGMNVGGPRPINLVLNKNGKPTNHLSNHPGANLANSPMGINNSENKTTLQKVKKIYL